MPGVIEQNKNNNLFNNFFKCTFHIYLNLNTKKALRQRSLATPTILSDDNLVRCSDEELTSNKVFLPCPSFVDRFRQLLSCNYILQLFTHKDPTNN